MRLVKVQANNLKGRSFAYDLSAEVAIVGDNFTGKTSIIDAIRLALIGHIPELGKTPKATRQLMSGEFMSVHLEFDDGSNADFETNGKQEREVLWAINRKEIPLLNASAYFAMTERERYQYVFGIAKIPEGFTAKSILDELRMLRFEQVHTPEALTKIVALLERPLGAATIQEGLDKALEDLASHFKYYNGRAKDTQGAVRVLTELKNQQEAMAGNAKQFSEAEGLAREEAQVAYKALLDLNSKTVAANQWAGRKQRATELRAAVSSTEESDKLKKLIEETTAQLKPKVESQYSELDVQAFRRAHTKFSDEFTEYSSALRERKKEREELDGEMACPHCGAKSRGWKDHLRNKLDQGILALTGMVDGSARSVAERKAELDVAEAAVKQAREDLAHNRILNERILGWQREIEKLAMQRRQWLARLEKEDRELAETKVDPVSNEEQAATTALNDKAEATYKEARQKLKTAELLEQDIKRAAQAQMEHEQAEAFVIVTKAAGKLLREKQASLVATVFGDLLHIANGIVGELLRSDLAFHDGEVGRWSAHQWISYKTFTGAEQALTFVAIAAALSQGAPFRLLIFDELGRLDTDNRALLLNVLRRALHDGWIDQWIVAGTHDSGPTDTEAAAAGIQLIEL